MGFKIRLQAHESPIAVRDSLTLDRWNPKIIQLPRYPRLWGVMDSAFQRGPGELRKSQKQTAVLSAVGGTARELY